MSLLIYQLVCRRGSYIQVFCCKVYSAVHLGFGITVRLQLHGASYRLDPFVLVLRYCANLKAIRYESMSLNRIVAEKSHRVIAAKFSLHSN